MHSLPFVSGTATVLDGSYELLASGHIYTVVGSLFLLICVLVCPVVEAVLACGLALHDPANSVGDDSARRPHSPSNRKLTVNAWTSRDYVARVMDGCSDLGLLDVYCMGMLVAAMVLAAIGDVLQCTLLLGWYFMIPAIALGYLHNALCGAVIVARESTRANYSSLAVGGPDEEAETGNSAVDLAASASLLADH